jgi:hypothetical protein
MTAYVLYRTDGGILPELILNLKLQCLFQFLLNPAHMDEMRNAHNLVGKPAGNFSLLGP